MVKIAVIVPEDLVDVAKVAASEFEENIHIIGGSMNVGLDLAKEYDAKGFDVIVARGGTQLLLKNSGISIPTVPIPITVTDVFSAIKEAEKYDKNIVILAFNNMLAASESFIKVSGNNYRLILVSNEEDVDRKMAQLASKKVKVVVGGGVLSKYSKKYGINTVVFKTGKEAIVSAIEEALRVVAATREENKKWGRFKTIVDNSNDGVISVDKDGYISIFNQAAEKLLKINGAEVIGKHVDHVLPELELTETIFSGMEEMDTIKNINDRKIMVSNIPIKVGDEVVDAVSMLQDVRKIQQMEEKIRREITSAGFSARYTFKDIIGVSKESKETIRIGKEYAKVNSTILIQGETGTGKEVMAQSIHNYSERANGPFVVVNCAALPENLLESELFGYAPGSFTGADRKGKRGLFELAHGGTIFLDEISEINPLIQGRLLRVLQEKQVMRIGDNKVIPVNIRVIAATNRNLYDLVLQRKFREDLYYRINVLNIVMLPLRRKREDIPLITNHFIKYYSENHGKPFIKITDEAFEYLKSYDWHGNIRELRNFVERLMVISKKTVIDKEAIRDNYLIPHYNYNEDKFNKYGAYSEKSGGDVSGRLEDLNDTSVSDRNLDYEPEAENIKKALVSNKGIINYAARELGISRTTLWRKMKKYGIEIDELDLFK